MNEQLVCLIKLQELDTEIDQLREKTERLPQAIEEARGKIEQAKAEHEKVQSEHEVLNRQRRDKERDLSGREEKIGKLQSRTTEIKTNKEYQAHLGEIEAAKHEIGTLEEALLILMDQADQMKKVLDAKLKSVEEEQLRFEKERHRMEGEIVASDGRLKQLEQESKSVSSKVEDRYLKEYHKLRNTRKGLAVVAVRDGTCQGCRLAVPPQLYADVRKNEKIQTCSQCARFLFWPTPV